MLTVRKSRGRGLTRRTWLESWHSFSFADYDDPDFRNVGALQVINEDRVQPGTGFPLHPHREVEILTYVLSGRLLHRDDMGHTAEITREHVQLLIAGTGLMHSEVNPSRTEPVHFLQIWLGPSTARRRVQPSYRTAHLPLEARRNHLQLLAGPTTDARAWGFSSDTRVFTCILEAGRSLDLGIAPHRRGWLQLAHGRLRVDDLYLEAGDGLMIEQHGSLSVAAESSAEFLLFDLE